MAAPGTLDIDPGTKLSHDSRWTGTVPAEARSCTNVGFIPVFFLTIVVCVIGGVVLRQQYDLVDPFEGAPSPVLAPGMNNGHIDRTEKVLEGTVSQRTVAAAVVGMSILMIIVWLALVRVATKVVVYGSIVGWIVLSVGMAIMMLLAGSIIFAVVFLIMTGVVCLWVFMCRHQIPLAIAFLREGSIAIFQNPVLAVGVVPAITIVAVVAYILMLYSWTGVAYMPDSPVMLGFAVFGVFSTYWVHECIMSIKTVSIAHCVASWYVMRRVRFGERASAFTGLILASTKHLGTVLYGALIIAIVATMRAIARYAQRRAGGGGSIAELAIQIIACCIACILACIEDIVRYVNRYSMIYVAIHGEDFCSSTKRVMQLFFRGDCQVFMNDIIVNMVITVCSLLMIVVIVVVGLVVTYVLTQDWSAFLAAPPLIAVAFGVVLIYLYADMLTTAVDAIFVSYVEDLERNVQVGQPLHCSPEWQTAVATYPNAPPAMKEVPVPPPLGVSDGTYQASAAPQTGYATGGPGYPTGGPGYPSGGPGYPNA